MPMITRQRVQDAVESKQFINQVFNFIDKRGAWKTRPEACIVAVRRMQQVKKFSGMLENAKAVGFIQGYLTAVPTSKGLRGRMLSSVVHKVRNLQVVYTVSWSEDLGDQMS